MIRILHDKDEGYPFMSQLRPDISTRHFSSRSRHKILSWIAGSWNIIRKSKKNDIIVCVYDFQAVLCHWFAKLTLRKRRILAINILLKQKDTLKNKIAKFLYRDAIRSPRFIATVTSAHYGRQLCDWLNVDKEFPILRDVFYSSYLPDQSPETFDGTVFCGGRNGRDWDFMIRVAMAMPQVRFNIVAPAEIAQKYSGLPPNISMLSDIPYSQFLDLLAKSSLVALPLDTQAPAGLIVIFQAAAHLKPVITTDTVSSRAYITPDFGYAKQNDLQQWIETITYILEHPDASRQKTLSLLKFLQTECSETSYIKRIEEIIRPWTEMNQSALQK